MAGFRSQFEAFVAATLSKTGCHYAYEPERISFVQPAYNRTYCPDFFVKDKGFYIEAKGLFSAADRKKHKLIQEQYPDLDIRFLFQNAYLPIRRGSKTTCADWATKNGFQWAHKTPPKEWFI